MIFIPFFPPFFLFILFSLGRTLTLSFIFQLEDKDASSHFHPFKEFNQRIGIYSPLSLSFPAQSSSSILSFHLQAKERLRGVSPPRIMSSQRSYSSTHSLPHAQYVNREIDSQHNKARPQEFHPYINVEELEDEIDESNISQKRGQIISSDFEDAPSKSEPITENSKDQSPSPLPSPFPLIRPPITEEEIDLDWNNIKTSCLRARKQA